jgi:HSP20 family protein
MKFFWAWEEKEENYEADLDEIKVQNNWYLKEKEEIEKEKEGQVALDIIENSLEIIIVSPIAGVDLEDIDISLKDDILTISWERKKPIELYNNSDIIRVSETFWWKFNRDIILPENLDLDLIKAILEKNILTIRIPKLKFKWQNIEIEKIED